MSRTCMRCGCPMMHDERLRIWRCPRCFVSEEAEDDSSPKPKQHYGSYKQGGALRSQKRK